MFDWSKKSLGFPGTAPSECAVCNMQLCVKGWIRWDDHVNCLACGSTFEVVLFDAPESIYKLNRA